MEGKVVRLYDRRLYNDAEDYKLSTRYRNSATYAMLAKADESKFRNPAGFEMLKRMKMDTEMLRRMSEEWEKAGDLEKKNQKRKKYYDKALAVIEHLSIKCSNANETRVLLKMKRQGLIEDIAVYRNLRRQKPFLFKDLVRG